MKISIIVPVYNGERWLHDCVDSLVSQKRTNCELEILLIDDGSTDSSGEICDGYSNKYKSIKAIHINNQGVSQARNIGLKAATGKWIMFVDCDDKLKTNAIETLYNNEFYKYDVVRFGAYIFGENIDSGRPYKPLGTNIIDKDEYVDLVTRRDTAVAVWGGIYAKALFIDNNIWFTPGIKCGEDWIVLFKIITNSKKFNYVDSFLYEYRWNIEGVTKKKSAKKDMAMDTAKAFFLILEYTRNKGINVSESSACKSRAIIRKEIMYEALVVNTKNNYENTNEVLRKYVPQSFLKDFSFLTKVKHKIVLVAYTIVNIFV